MSKKLNFGVDALSKINYGVRNLAKAVKVTLGPKGRTVLLYRGIGSPHVTKDGVTVSKDILFEDSTANMAADLVKQVTSKTADQAGDGTTTATVLTEAIFSRAYKLLVKKCRLVFYKRDLVRTKVNSMDLKRGMDLAVKDVELQLNKKKIPVKNSGDIFNIAKISSNNDAEMGKLISDAYKKLGPEGVIINEESPYMEPKSKLNIIEGIRLDKGYMSPSFTNNNEKSKVEFKNPMFLLIPGVVINHKSLVKSMEISLEKNKPLVIVAEDFDISVIEFLVKNRLQMHVKVVAIKASGMGEDKYQRMLDLAALTGCKTLDPTVAGNLNIIQFESMGTANKIIVKKDHTTIVSDNKHSKDLNKRILVLEEEATSEITPYQRDSVIKRLAQLKGKLALIQVGARTEAELKEKKDRLDDAIEATKSAIEEGYVAGSGLTLFRISETLSKETKYFDNKDIRSGYKLVLDAIKEPFYTILSNSGIESKVLENINKELNSKYPEEIDKYKFRFGYNSLTDRYVDLIEEGVIDPVKVTRLALINAASVAGLLMTTGCSVSIN